MRYGILRHLHRQPEHHRLLSAVEADTRTLWLEG